MKAIIPAIVNVVALVLLVAGFLTPGWIVLNIFGISVHIGLFYMAGSYKTTTVELTEFLIEMIFGVIFCILATIFMWVYTYSKRSHIFLLTPIIMNLLSGILTWVAVGRVLHAVILLKSYSLDMGVSYSLILCGLGGILCFVTMIIIWIKQNKDSKEQEVSQPGVVILSAGQPQFNSGYDHAFSQKYIIRRI